MNIQIITHNQIIGCHQWSTAPREYEYLANPHRHVFSVRCKFEVSHTDREIEINHKQEEIEMAFRERFGSGPSLGGGLEFGSMSCEDIATWCILTFDCEECEVLEDGFGGAIVRK